MLGAKERVYDEHARAAEAFDCRGRDAFRVRDVCHRPDAEREHGDRAVRDRDGQDFGSADEKRHIRLDDVRAPLRFRGPSDRAAVVEDVRELAAQALERFGGAVHRERRVATDGERPEIVDAVGVVGVIMREEHRIDTIDPGGDQL